MSAEFFTDDQSRVKVGVAGDLINALRASDERGREKLLSGVSQGALGSDENDPLSPPLKNTGYSPWADVKLQGELKSALDAAAVPGRDEFTRQAIQEKLDQVRSTVNKAGLADGFELQDIKSADSLTISNRSGGQNHDSLTVDLKTGAITDQFGVSYISQERDGKISFVPAPPVTVQDNNGIKRTFDHLNGVTKVTLPDGTTLTADNLSTYQVSDPSGNPAGLAQDLVFDDHSLSYHIGPTVVSIDGDRMVSDNVKTNEIKSKAADAPGELEPAKAAKERAIDQQILQRAIAEMHLNPLDFSIKLDGQ